MTTLSTGSKPETKPTLRFDAEQHRYWLGDRELPSVTTVLKSAGIIDPSKYAAGDSALRGTYVHEAIAMSNLSVDLLDGRLRGYVEAWRAFSEATGLFSHATEERVFNEGLGYAGTLDFRGGYQGECWLLDIKTGGRERWHGLQTVAYCLCLPDPYKYRRAAVHLSPDGTYKMVVHNTPDDWDVFRAALNVYNWKGKS